ncbi:MAG: NAD(+)/NADH kinase [Clostridia bacterium]
MKAMYLVMHQRKPNVVALTEQIVSTFHRAGMSVTAEPWLEERMGERAGALFAHAAPACCEAIVSVGGDGTLLRSNMLSVTYNLPLIGVNVGTLGFMAEVELQGLDAACARLAADEYTIEERMMLKAELGGRALLALNDVVLSRGAYSRLIGLNAYVGEEPIGRYIADGLIVSTPTGSTGYSLSAGGPIVSPEVECMLLTPICAHSLQHRPVITSAAQRVSVQLDREHAPKALVCIDGRQSYELTADQTLVITRAERKAQFIRLEPRSFFSMIRYKLSEWSC